MKKIFAVFVVFLLLFGCLGVSATPLPEIWKSWLNIAFLALLFSFFLISFTYVLAEVLALSHLKVWAINELYQTLATAMFVGGLVIIIPLSSALLPAFAKTMNITFETDPVDPIEEAIRYGNWMADCTPTIDPLRLFLPKGKLCEAIFLYGSIYAVLGAYKSTNIKNMAGRIGLSVSPFSLVARPIMDVIQILLNMFAAGIGLFIIQTTLLQFIKDYMLTVFLPIGIVFRSFPFTRGIGGTLIAVAVSLYVVYPLVILSNKALMVDYLGGEDGKLKGIEKLKEFVTGTTFLGLVMNLAVITSAIGAIFTTSTLLAFIAAIVGSSGIIFALLPFLFDALKGALALGLIGSLVLPVFSIFVTLTFMKNLSIILGGEITFAAFAKFI